MLFKAEDPKNEIFTTISHELHRGSLDRKHPFRFVVLSSSTENEVESRYVVLRKVGQDLHFFFLQT